MPSGRACERGCCSSRRGWSGSSLFTLYPALASLYYSFTNFKILQSPRWVGLDNYAALLRDPAVLEVDRQHAVPDADRGPARGRRRPRHRPPAQQSEGPRAGGLPDDLLPARRDPRLSPAPLLFIFLLNPSNGLVNQILGLRRHRRTRLVLRSRMGEERADPADGLGRRRRRDHLSRRAPGRVAIAVRGRGGRRRRSVGEAAPRDDPDDQPGDPVQPDRRRDRARSSCSRRRS